MNNAHSETPSSQKNASTNQGQTSATLPVVEKSIDAAARRATTAAPDSVQDSAVDAGFASARDQAAGQELPSKPKLNRKQKIGLAAAAALSVLVIGVSAAALFLPQQPATGEGSQASSESLSAATDSSSAAPVALASNGEEAGIAPESSEVPATSREAAAEVPQVSPGASSSESNAGAAGGSSASAAPPVVEAPPAPAPAPTVTVSVSVDSSAVGSPVSGGTSVTFSPGASVYDALMACGLSVNANTSPVGVYVSAIGGLAEHEYGGMSGWKYSINGGSPPGVACSAYILSDGDVVSWFYSL